MSSADSRVPIGRVGRAHGVDGSFYVDGAAHPLAVGIDVTVAGEERRVTRRAGTDARPLVRLEGITDRSAAAAMRGQPLLAPRSIAPLGEREWLADDLVGCCIDGLGRVRRVVPAPSCDVLVVGDEERLVPFVGDAIRSVDPAARRIEVDRAFLGLEGDRPGSAEREA